jgi:uncharacterized membrane protein
MSMSDDTHDLLKGWFIYTSLMLFSSAIMVVLVVFIKYSNRKCINNNTVAKSVASTEVSTGASTGNIDLSQYTVVIDEDNKTVHLKAK